jgi:hypothetical protein
MLPKLALSLGKPRRNGRRNAPHIDGNDRQIGRRLATTLGASSSQGFNSDSNAVSSIASGSRQKVPVSIAIQTESRLDGGGVCGHQSGADFGGDRSK